MDYVHFLQEVPEGRKDSPGGPWQFIGLMPLFDPPRHDSAETIRRALNLGVNVKMITGTLYVAGKSCLIYPLGKASVKAVVACKLNHMRTYGYY